MVSPLRLRDVNQQPLQADGDYVLYWMIANRRAGWNFSLDHAIECCLELKKPLLVLEALRVGYRWASDRIHSFVIDGMQDNQPAFDVPGVLYYPYLEHEKNDGEGLLETLARRACLVVTDDFPSFFLPGMIQLAGRKLPVRLQAVDSNGILPMRAASTVFQRAFDFRRFLQRELRPWLEDFPLAKPLAKLSKFTDKPKLACDITKRWPTATADELSRNRSFKPFAIDHAVPVVDGSPGGTKAARKLLADFLKHKVNRYEDRNVPDDHLTSGLSPYLHFGHISSQEILSEIFAQEGWSPKHLGSKVTGQKEGWWGLSPGSEGFMDQVVTWREVGYNMAWQRRDHDRYDCLPAWCHATLEKHEKDKREHLYSLEEFETAQTHDELWNAAQNQLRIEGTIHNYLRMLWAKKVLEWTPNARTASEILVHLNNKYALDGRNPNSYSGIFWCFGRYDRPWAPERPIFGNIRYMSSDNTRRKVSVKDYLKRFSVKPNSHGLFD